MKKLFYLFVAATLTVGFVSCSEKPAEETTEPVEATTEEPAVEAPVDTTAAAAPADTAAAAATPAAH